MLATFKTDSQQRSTNVFLEPGDYDAALPVALHLHSVPLILGRDRKAVIAALYTHDCAAGILSVADNPCSVHVAKGIRRFFDPVVVTYEPVSQKAVADAARASHVYIDFARKVDGTQYNAPKGAMTIRLTSEGAGAFFSESLCIIASNLDRYVGMDSYQDFSTLLRHISAAFVFSEDLYFKQIDIVKFWKDEILDRRFAAAVELLNSVGVKLVAIDA